jgi:hypothetical protein
MMVRKMGIQVIMEEIKEKRPKSMMVARKGWYKRWEKR